jgi:glutaminase
MASGVAMNDWQQVVEELHAGIRMDLGGGQVANYIPALAKVDPEQFGVALATVDGNVAEAGDSGVPFSLQSITKLFALILALPAQGERLWTRVGKEPSGNAFNSLVQLEHEEGIPRNPFINAGALVVTDVLHSLTGGACRSIRDFLREESGDPAIDLDPEVAASEAAHGHRNAALAHFMASCGNIRNPVDTVLDQYFQQCSLALSCRDLARAGLVLARHGTGNGGGRRLTRSEAKRIQALMMTCGTYDAAGEVAYRVGLPCKSGVGGGILAILPQVGAVAVWSPRLDEKGNSVAGVEFLDRLTTRTGLSVF